jgi:hypothetical protein
MRPSLALLRSTNLLADAASLSLHQPERRVDVLLPTDASQDADGRPRRRRIWELAESLHCSVIGTCLSTGELRRIFVKLGSSDAEAAGEHDLHVLGVTTAAERDAGAKFLQKALDTRHGVAIRRYAAARDEAALARLWGESLQQGDIPGGYWALLTHPNTTRELVKKAFQDVHMLSHLVGAANRADIRRLHQIEKENEALANKLRRQETHLRDGFRFRDHTIQLLREMLTHRNGDATRVLSDAGADGKPCPDMLSDLNLRLGQEEARRHRVEQRLTAVTAGLQKAQADLRKAERERDALGRHVDVVEAEIVRLIEPPRADIRPCLAGDTLLYVGGRASQIPQIKAWVERAGGHLLHHDGGIEHSLALLPGLISRADVMCFPVDCVSHDAVVGVKRLCRQMQKPYLPLRTSSVGALISALAGSPGVETSDAE